MTDPQPSGFDTSVAHPARIYDYYLGGKDNFPVDRAAAEATMKFAPELPMIARANRAFLGRAVRYLISQGVTQFLDLGTGIPSPGNTGEVARSSMPDARVVYVDYDPFVAAHSRALLAGAAPGLTAVVQADVRDPKAILTDDAVRDVLDFDRPIGVLMLAVLHFVTDQEGPGQVVKAFADAVVPGSHFVISHGTDDLERERAQASAAAYKAVSSLTLRSRAAISALFGDLELVDPGVVQITAWRPDGEVPPGPVFYGGVAVRR